MIVITRFRTVKRTRKTHECYNCFKIIPIGSTCTYGVTTDSDITRYKNQILTGYFCTECRDIQLNIRT